VLLVQNKQGSKNNPTSNDHQEADDINQGSIQNEDRDTQEEPHSQYFIQNACVVDTLDEYKRPNEPLLNNEKAKNEASHTDFSSIDTRFIEDEGCREQELVEAPDYGEFFLKWSPGKNWVEIICCIKQLLWNKKRNIENQGKRRKKHE